MQTDPELTQFVFEQNLPTVDCRQAVSQVPQPTPRRLSSQLENLTRWQWAAGFPAGEIGYFCQRYISELRNISDLRNDFDHRNRIFLIYKLTRSSSSPSQNHCDQYHPHLDYKHINLILSRPLSMQGVKW